VSLSGPLWDTGVTRPPSATEPLGLLSTAGDDLGAGSQRQVAENRGLDRLLILDVSGDHALAPREAVSGVQPRTAIRHRVTPRPGRPLKILYAPGIAAPLTVAGTLIFDRWRVLGSAEHSLSE
jgi:hypothetical protein